MAQNITISGYNPENFQFQTYSPSDENLVPSVDVTKIFDPSTDYIEYYIFDYNNSTIFSTYNYRDYRVFNDVFEVNAETDIAKYNLEDGLYRSYYNILSPRISSNNNNRFYIDTISTSRTELRLKTNNISYLDTLAGVDRLLAELNNDTLYYNDFYLNFGNNKLVLANNVLFEGDETNYSVLIKLYEPLPNSFSVKDTCWVVQQLQNLAYNAEITSVFEDIIDYEYLKGPNINLSIKDQINNSTEYQNYSNLVSSNSSSLQYQLNSLFEEKGIEINVDYSDYSNFIYLSSVQRRIENFYYKLSLIEEYQTSSSLAGSSPLGTYSSGSQNIYQEKINHIITNFDGYEYFLYFDSGSKSWPKTNSEPPYSNATTGSVAGQNWLTSELTSASLYDELNTNWIYRTIPSYLSDDPSNQPLELFVDMLGQHFDNIWIYYKDVSNKYNADNRLDYGVSKDLVADIIRDFGIKIYQNNFSVDNLFEAFLGFDSSGSFVLPSNASSTLPITGNNIEYITSYVTSSNSNGSIIDGVPLDDVNKRVYKRIFHNLPYLIKKKGTIDGLRTLITSYGIPNTILQISEFGGRDVVSINDWDLWQNKFNYKYDTENTGYISSSFVANGNWEISGSNRRPKTVEFRFKPPTSGSSRAVQYAIDNPNTVLWSLDDGSETFIALEYTASGFTSGSYSGSIPDPNNQYGFLKFYPTYNTDPSLSASLYLPFFDGDWWAVSAIVDSGTASLYAGNKIYQGNDGSQLGFTGSISITGVDSTIWDIGSNSYFPSDGRNNVGSNSPFSGSYQEIRYYTIPLSESAFHDYVMNPQSIESDDTSNELLFRASLGGELYTGSNSIHPKVSGSWVSTSSFASTSEFTIRNGSFTPNSESVFINEPLVGTQNRVTNKINIATQYRPSGNTLSGLRSIEQYPIISQSINPNINLLEVAFSPQNEINDDIAAHFGDINILDYIGDPRAVSSSLTNYPLLDNIRDAYFEKYVSNYDLNDYIRLIKYFDNSLFKMLQDFVPARTSLASGIVIKPHLLERQKYPVPQVTISSSLFADEPPTKDITLTASIDSGSFIVGISGSSGGIMPSPIEETYSGSFALTSDVTINLSQSGFYLLNFNVSTADPLDNFIIYDGQDTSGPALISGFSGSFNQVVNVSSGFLYINDAGSLGALTFEYITGSILQYHQELVPTPSGSIYKVFDNSDFYNGELSGSTIIATTQSLDNCQEETNWDDVAVYSFDINHSSSYESYGFLYPVNAIDPGVYLSSNTPNTGEITLFFQADLSSVGYPTYNPGKIGALYAKVSTTDKNGNDISDKLRIAQTLIVQYDNTIGDTYIGNRSFPIISAVNKGTYFQFVLDQQNSIDQYGNRTWTYQNPCPWDTGTTQYGLSQTNAAIILLYPPPGFANSDCNPLINNVTEARPNSVLQDVDYTTDQIEAINLQLIKNGAATPAQVPDSYYSSQRVIIPRYLGSKNTSDHINVWNENGVGNYGKTSCIDVERSYFGLFNFINSSAPELYNKSEVDIRYIVDDQGRVFDPDPSSNNSYYSILVQNFEDSNASVSLTTSNGFNVLNSSFPVLRSGQSVQPVIYTELSSYPSASWAPSISFEGIAGSFPSIPNYGFLSRAYTQTVSYIPSGTKIQFTNEIYDPSNSFNVADSIYTITSSLTEILFAARLDLVLVKTTAPNDQSGRVKYYYRIEVSSDGGTTWVPTSSSPLTEQYYSEGIQTRALIDPYSQRNIGDKFRVVIQKQSMSPGFELRVRGGNSGFSAVPKASPSGSVNNFWETGSSSANVLTASVDLTLYQNLVQTHLSGSGFKEALPFTVQIGDEFRFESNESKVYFVKNTYNDNNNLYAEVTPDIIDVDLDHFLLRRYVNDKTVLLDTNRISGSNSTGILYPEYPTPTLRANFDRIISDLRQKNIF